jgi:ATP-binding cassette subfamily B (MDR/TAP) protein 7
MLALRSATALGNVRIQCVRVLAPPRLLTPARAYWQQAAVRSGPSYRRPRAEWSTSGAWPSPLSPHPCLPPRSVAPHPCRLFRHLAAQDAKSAPQSSKTAAAAAGVNESPHPTPTSKATVSNAEQRRRDWAIVRRLLVHIWPKDDWETRGRVVLGVGLLISGKVRLSSLLPPIFAGSSLFVGLQLLNVQVPLFFKQVIDTLNIPIDAQSTVWIVCGSVILGCM